MDERDRSKNNEREEGWEQKTASTGEQALRNEERSLDVGESGQHAPGGYYNQHGVNEPDRSALNDDDI